MTDDDTTTLSLFVQEQYRDAGKRVGKAEKRRPQEPCRFEGCGEWAWARGYCGVHYQKLRREGDLPVVRRNIGDPVARFHASYLINPETGCWDWTGWIHPKGYGVMPMGGNGKKVRAHRFSWELHNGPIPDGLSVLHRCDRRVCCAPAHLFLGDSGENARDMVRKGRHGSQTGALRPRITAPMAMNIRVMFARGGHSMQGLADIYGVEPSTISDVLKGRSHQGA